MKTAPVIVQQRGAGVDLQRAQDFANDAQRQAIAAQILHGNLLTFETDSAGKRTDGISFTAATPKKVPHRLGRKPNGWFVVRDFGTNAHALLETTTNTDATYLYLTSSATCKVYL